LGGLYYFQENDELIGDLSPNKLFGRINGVQKLNLGTLNYTDVYNSTDLYRTPGTYFRSNFNESVIDSTGTYQANRETVKFPSVRLLNRSLYSSDSETFKVKTGINNGNDVSENVVIKTKSIIPSVGFGIQNTFLNYYNKTLFGEYLNGTKTKENDGLPHVLSGGYTGILKPIKTYDSDEIEFTAFYRNLSVFDFSINENDLVNELKEATKNLKRLTLISTTTDQNYLNNLMIGYTKSFLVYSKLKAVYLSGKFGSEPKNRLKEIITKLSDVNNIDSKFNVDSTTKLFDFYFLVSHVFFTSFHRVNNAFSNLNIQPFDLKYRLMFGSSGSGSYQESAIGNELNNILNLKYNSKAQQIDSLTNFLYKIWEIEKVNLKKPEDYGFRATKATFALYPSAGGFISPNALLTSVGGSNIDKSLTLQSSNSIENFVYSRNASIAFNLYNSGNRYNESDGNYGLRHTLLVKSGRMVDPLNSNSASVLFNKLTATTKSDIDNPTSEKYLLDKEFDRVNFLENYCFNNHSILNNTTRFFWFENNRVGDNMKLDVYLNSYDDNNNGLKDAFNTDFENRNLNFLRNIDLKLNGHEGFVSNLESKYNSVFDFSRLMDSINIEKLIEFSDEFKKFSTISADSNASTFNLNSLIKASTVLKDNDLFSVADGFKNNTITGVTGGMKLTKDDVTLLLIGNSMYNYEFLAKCGVSKVLNIALTSAQKSRCEHVATEFGSYISTFANKSTIDSVTKLGDFQLSIHNFHSSPEVLFTNAKTYDDLKKALIGNISELNFNKLIARRILIGNQYVPPYRELQGNEIAELEQLNRSYLYSKIHHPIGVDVEIRYDDYYVNVVKGFFKYLNIRYTKDNYKQLLKLIRGYAYHVSSSNKNINSSFLPNFGIVSSQTYLDHLNKIRLSQNATRFNNAAPADNTRVVLPVNPNLVINNVEETTPTFEQYSLQQSNIDNLSDSYFSDFNKTTFESIVSGLNGFLDRVNTNISARLSSDSENSLTKQSAKDAMVNEFKKTTYYNVKSLFDKISTGGMEQSSNSVIPNAFIPSKVEDIKSIEVSDILNNVKLFYNYSINPNYCNEGSSGLVDSSYDLYQIFQIVDRGNNDIGVKILGDLVYLYNNLYADFDTKANPGQDSDVLALTNLTEGTVQKLFSGLAVSSGFLFQQIPNYLNLNGYLGKINSSTEKNAAESIYELVDELFGVHTDTSLLGENRGTVFGGLTGFPGYIFQLGALSSNLSTSDKTSEIKKNDNLNSFCLDVGYDDNREVVVKADGAPDEILKSNVTCFTVDFGTQNQQMFTSVQLDTAEFYDTEESIRTWVDVVNNTQQTIQTSNIFPILEKRSYSCTVTGLGNATIQPLSYFYLRNVPLFYGSYWITNVIHDIKPNTMITTFKGVRQPIASKNDVRKQLLYLMRERAAALKEANVAANVIQTEGIPDTSGDIYVVPVGSQATNENDPYGYVMQKTSSNSFYKFDGIEVLSSFIVSVTKTDGYTAANIGLINTLYNQSRALVGNDTHSDVVRNMKNVAIGIMNQKSKNQDSRYADPSFNNVSLSKLVKENKFSTTSRLYTLLSDMSANFDAYSKEDDLIKLDKNEKIYSVKVSDGTGGLDRKNDANLVTFLMDSEINTTSADNILINQSLFYIDQSDKFTALNTTIDGFGSKNENSSEYPDIFALFDSLSDNQEIRSLNESKEITKIKPAQTGNEASRPIAKTEAQIELWFPFLRTAKPKACQFALFVSDGNYRKNDYEKWLKARGVEPTGDESWDKVAKNTENPEFALQAIYYGLVNPIPEVTDPTGTGDIAFNFGDGEKSYNIDSDTGKKRFLDDYKKVINEKISRWDTDNKKPEQELSKTTVKFLGAYTPGVAFFTANEGGNKPFGKITWGNEIKKKYKLNDATNDQLSNEFVPTTLGSAERAFFIQSLTGNANEEYNNWRNGSEVLLDSAYGTNTTVTGLLDKYWKVATGAIKYDGTSPWSAAFISYIIKDAAPIPDDFKYSAEHSEYIVNARGNNKSWKAYSTKDSNIVLQIGDLLCYARNGDTPISVDLKDFASNQSSHCDCVTEIDLGKSAKAIGGNLGKTVAFSNINLNANGSVNDKNRTVILRFEPVSNTQSLSTNLTDTQKADNQVKIKNLLKNAGLTKEQAAGIMGNIQKESGFNPLAGWIDVNSYPSYGLIQWNGRFTPKNGTKDKEVLLDTIGRTVEAQIEYLLRKTTTYQSYIKQTTGLSDPYMTAYKFAELVEICADCNKGFDVYNNKTNNKYKTYQRSEYAVDFNNRFNNASDSLYWDGKGGSNSTTSSTVVIGDSLYSSIKSANGKIGLINNPEMASVGKHLSLDSNGVAGKSLITLLKELNPQTNVKNVIVTIGANDLWTLNTVKQNESIALIKQKFPNAKYYIMNGNYGWGNLKVTNTNTDSVWQTKITDYINVFKQGGFDVIGSITKVLKHPEPNDNFYKTYEAKLKTFA
jgi:hypothetical protein